MFSESYNTVYKIICRNSVALKNFTCFKCLGFLAKSEGIYCSNVNNSLEISSILRCGNLYSRDENIQIRSNFRVQPKYISALDLREHL